MPIAARLHARRRRPAVHRASSARCCRWRTSSGARSSRRARRNGTARRASRSPTTTTCAQAGLLGLCVPEAHGGLGADYATYMMVAAEIGRFCGATALTCNMHVCSTLWTGVLADGIADDAGAARRARAPARSCTSRASCEDGAIYAQPFSEGSAAAAGRAPFGTTARKVDGGWRRQRQQDLRLAFRRGRLLRRAVHRGQGRAQPDRARHALPRRARRPAEGFAIVGDWDPLGMRGTVSRNLTVQGRVRPRRRAAHAARRLLQGRADAGRTMFFTLAPTYLGIASAAYDFTVSYLRGEVAGRAAGQAPHVPDQADRRGADAHPARDRRARSSCAPSQEARAEPVEGRAHAPVRRAVHGDGGRQRHLPRSPSAPAAARA